MTAKLRGHMAVIGIADGALREAIRRTLEREGAAVAASARAGELLSDMRTRGGDICLLDADLAGADLESLLLQIRSLDQAMPIVLVSSQPTGTSSYAAGLTLLPLPFRRRELIDLMQQLLRQDAPSS
ncbi:MAG: response regulator [Candidatus Eisenbacteria bacterium]|nr:response regulator [Candidatus Eisenbacteria bacterium]